MTCKDAEKQREYHNQWRESHREKGLCIECNRSCAKNSTQCLFHLDYKRRLDKRLYNSRPEIRDRRKILVKNRQLRLKSQNRCVGCGMPLSDESRAGIYCINCYNGRIGTGY